MWTPPCRKPTSYTIQGTSVKPAGDHLLLCNEPEWTWPCKVPRETKPQFLFLTESKGYFRKTKKKNKGVT